MNTPALHIAIDGPVASGKGEMAARLAKKYNLLYIYTGAMYRALALFCIEREISFHDEEKIVPLLATVRIEILPPKEGDKYPYVVLLNGKDVTMRIFQQDAAQGASDVATITRVRQWMVAKQKELAAGRSVVMEGRDIALRVLPQAQLKIYLTASVEERAKRRWKQWKAQGLDKTYEETFADTKIRDHQDMTREADPLQKVPDAWELDTTGKSIDEAMNMIDEELHKRNLL